MDLVGFFNQTLFFYSLIFSYIVKKKIVLEKNHVIKFYEIKKIKGYEKIIVHPTPIALGITIVIHNVLLFFFYLFFQIYFCRFHLLKLRLLRI
jgi:energy-converting hydrogenase Eha subunit A